MEYFYQSSFPITTLHVDAHVDVVMIVSSKDTVNVRLNDHAKWLTLDSLYVAKLWINLMNDK